ncbi:hypothetical protein DRE_00190 [Drechslerella stenobrocha 248]|uniref:Uncharacterized protein n=1 Tax=Drechslerella stenobrocha 248 TaxID=1043628 RepID=W7IHW6_9PEZI|nr:hypothetical protein DRE_00190 [Drechslerella stenobrocha 248]
MPSRPRSRSRSLSMSSDTALSSVGVSPSIPAPLISVVPEAAYIATSAATQIVTSDHESFFQTLFTEGIVKAGPPTIIVTPDALRLVNQFLDYLLWAILSVGKSTALKALRPAVIEVLKSRLAREAIASAEAELEEYLGDPEDGLDDIPLEIVEFDLDQVWKKARLRCMIYSSLGDLEEEDEETYDQSARPLSSPLEQYARIGSATTVSPAVAIFMTSILEFIGEQTLLVAGHATVARFSQARIAAAAEESTDGSYEAVDRPSVEELDMEKVALNPVLGRMWRQWKKLLRGPAGGQIASRAPSRRDSRRQSSISAVSIQSVMEGKAECATPSGSRDISTKEPGTEYLAQAEDNIPAGVKSGLRRLASAEVLGSAPLTPIPETPANAAADGTKATIADMVVLKYDRATRVPEYPRPSSMTTLSSHPADFVFPFTKLAAPKDISLVTVTERVDERLPRHVRANSLPLPGEFPFTLEQVDFPQELARQKLEDGDNVATPVSRQVPQLPVPQPKEQDTISLAETECTAADVDDDAGELCTLDSFVVHETAEATATTPTFYRAQTVRIISTSSAPIGFEINERKSSSTINTLRDTNTKDEDGTATHTDDSTNRQSVLYSPDDIGVARTSNISILPAALPTPVQSPIVNEKTIAEQIPHIQEDIRKSEDSGTESSGSATKDIARQRRRRSKYYTPAPAPTAPDFFPEHHTAEEIAQHQEKAVEEIKPPIVQAVVAQEDASQSRRKSVREELLDMYSQDPEFDDDEPAPVKRQTKPSTRSLRVSSPIGSPGLSQTSRSTHSNSSESLVGRSHSSSALAADIRQYPSLDLPRPTSNRDVTTPTSGHERAGVRMWTPPATPDDSKGRYKASAANKSKGHSHSNSMSSQTSAKLKNFITGRPTTAEEKRQGNRADWDTESAYSDTHSHAAKVDEKERNFEQLINSGTTLQYTLTPDNVKRIDLEIASSRKGSGESGRTKTPVDRYVSMTPSKESPSPKRSNSQKSRPLTTISSDEQEDIVPEIPSKSTRSPNASQSSAANSDSIKFFPPRARSSSGSMSQPPPRSASLNAINTSVKSKPIPITVANGPISPIDSPTSATTTVRSGMIPRRPTTGSLHSSYNASISDIRPLRSADSKSRLIARAPQPASADSTLALIDFFRNTPPPPGSSDSSATASSRAPYKSVMDPKFNGSISTPQGSMTSIAEKSTSLSSFHSQADLIKKPEPAQRSPRISQRPHTENGPARKQVRIKDPYRIESDDEEDTPYQRPGRKLRHEESLVDFLMNVPPPESPAPSQTSFTQQKPLKKKSSAAQLISRLRPGSRNSVKISKANVSAPVEARQSPKLPNSGSNATSRKHVPLPVKTVIEEQFPPRAKSSGAASAMTMPHSMRKTQMFQARDAKTHAPESDSSGLADFLRYTGPTVTLEPATVGTGKGGFGEKKKRGVVAV